MKGIKHTSQVGHMLAWASNSTPLDLILSHDTVREVGQEEGWVHFACEVSLPIDPRYPAEMQDDVTDVPCIAREDANHLYLLSARRRVSHDLLSRVRVPYVREPPLVNVRQVVEDIEAGKLPEFCLSRIYAMVPEDGHLLSSVILFGESVTESQAYQTLAHGVTPYRIELADAVTGDRIVSLSAQSQIGFGYTGKQSLSRAWDVLQLLSELPTDTQPYIQWPEI